MENKELLNVWFIFTITLRDKNFASIFGGKVGKLEKKKGIPLKMVLFSRIVTKYIKMKKKETSVYSRHYLGKHD